MELLIIQHAIGSFGFNNMPKSIPVIILSLSEVLFNNEQAEYIQNASDRNTEASARGVQNPKGRASQHPIHRAKDGER